MKLTAVWILGAIALGVALHLPAAHADTPPLLEIAFEKDAGDWDVYSPTGTVTGKISITHEAAHIKEGKGALQFDYTIKKGDLGVLGLRVPPDAITKMNAFTFPSIAKKLSPNAFSVSVRVGSGALANIASTSCDTWSTC